MISPDFALLAALLPPAGFASYIRGTLHGRVQPNRVSWALWAVSPMVAFAAELAGHVSAPVAAVTFGLGFGPLLVVVSTFARAGGAWRLGLADYACGAVSVLALAAWAVTGRGDAAIALSIAADAFAAAPTIAKSWSHPESESAGTYVASGTAGVVALLALPSWRFAGYGFPLYVAAVCAVITVLVVVPRPAARRARQADVKEMSP
jgi:hypothetical protein